MRAQLQEKKKVFKCDKCGPETSLAPAVRPFFVCPVDKPVALLGDFKSNSFSKVVRTVDLHQWLTKQWILEITFLQDEVFAGVYGKSVRCSWIHVSLLMISCVFDEGAGGLSYIPFLDSSFFFSFMT